MPAATRPCPPRRFPTDLTDAQWCLLAPLLPLPRSGPGRPGRPATSRRALINAILYVRWTGCPWRALPDCYPHWRTVHHHLARWAADGTLARLHAVLRGRVRAAAGRTVTPTAAVIDSQSVRASDWVSRATKGYDAAKKVHGRKRHVAVDTCGLLLDILVTPASTQDRDGGRRLLWRLRRHLPTIQLVWADAGYAGKLVTWAQQVLTLTLQIVRKRQGVHHFEVLPRRWVVERSFSWLGKYRRLAVDYERKPEHHQAWVQWAMVRVMVKRLTRQAPPQPTRTLSLAA
jgi:putative transposase